jgi:hypothetical protein
MTKVVATLAVVAALLTPTASSGRQAESGFWLELARLSPQAVVPPGGDPQGGGSVSISVGYARNYDALQYEIGIFAGQKPTAFHLHHGRAGRNGPLVKKVELGWSTPSRPWGGSNSWSGATVIPHRWAVALGKHPGAFYVDVHTRAYPRGVARAQLRGPVHRRG